MFRLRFLFKSHVPTNLSTMTQLACLFCNHDGRTTREGDATVFGSQKSLMEHLARHPQPLPAVEGLKVLYGKVKPDDLSIFDFDLQFPDPPQPSTITEAESQRLAKLPVAKAIKEHVRKYGERELAGPDGIGEAVLQFYDGSRIIGVEYIEKGDGKWCTGWHNGERGYFPSKIIALEPPSKGEVRLPGMNNDGVTLKARWKFAPKDSSAGWLSFGPNDTISNVSCKSPTQVVLPW